MNSFWLSCSVIYIYIFSVLPINSLIKLIKCPIWVWILTIIYSMVSFLSTPKPKITVYYWGVSIFSKIYYWEVIYGINQSLSPEFLLLRDFLLFGSLLIRDSTVLWKISKNASLCKVVFLSESFACLYLKLKYLEALKFWRSQNLRR